MRKTTRLSQLIHAPELLVMPGAFDALSARIVQEAGFAAVQCSGFGISVSRLGLPDYSFLAFSDMVEATRRIVDAVELPVMADGDTGFGNAVNAWYAVRAFERIGCAGVNIEDQLMPKRCGHLEGKSLIPLDEAVQKIRACAEARTDADFVINARTDALAVGGIGEVIRRGNAYLEAGATMVFIDGMTSKALAREAVAGIRGPVAINVVEGGKSPEAFTFAEMEAMGIARVSLPGTLMLAAIQGMRDALAAVRANGYAGGPGARLADFRAQLDLVGFAEVFALEQRYLSALAAPAAVQ
ncbi:carboxyvinyl-carboxyphosphonate phosphorylmutase [Cupriavidus sp. USMAA2-4]|uniref:Carboxyvinyl-carboxyphosphonate phosphorylmutase n=1 Tax=Cupriavidus malaysiensis TaxID=367825 RepID=A0ABN4TUT9_9BURK|nr:MULTISPECIES: isocitrate lyase/PEP mutase family protein [Cupriavidus]AOY97246.1 carboxyvinyl-carboxyphosphonate phosphorylmutase [Cupriavidus sp. USMAA2-4]AOZ03503.1 carboxyvinyl-carboxyphosphonate phosphorylmutase [Cupriavidus sp. USMAHM13]AOZ09135.1 carboxyvinyl-carboxyphosphonate phosphorylmutase [Cupriavidus malaysiensis]